MLEAVSIDMRQDLIFIYHELGICWRANSITI